MTSAAQRRSEQTRPANRQHPLSQGPAKWLLFLSVTVGMSVVLLSIERIYATLGLGAMLLLAVGYAIRQTGVLPAVTRRAQRLLVSPTARWLAFAGVFAALLWAMITLQRPYSTIALAVMLAGWGGLVLWALNPVQRLRDAALIERLQAKWWGRWLVFAVVAVAVYGLITSLESPYSSLALLTLVVAALPVTWVQRSADSVAARAALMRSLMFVAVVMAAAAAHVVQTASGTRYEAGWRLMVLGGVPLGVAVHLGLRLPGVVLPALPVPAKDAMTPARLKRIHKWLFGFGVLCIVLLTEGNVRLLKIPMLVNMSVHVQFVLLVLGILLVSAGLGGAGLRWPNVNWRTVGLVGLITGLALFLRFWQLQDALRLFVDELNFSAVVRTFWNVPNVPLLEPMSSIAAFPYIYPYFQAHTIELFGRNLVGLRGTSAIVGALTVPAVYLLGRVVFDRKVGLIAALLLATFPPHLHFSRLGLNNIADPLVGTLGFALVARGLIKNRRFDYALGGAVLGLTHYFYEGGRLVFLPVVVVWLVGLAYLWRPRVRWRTLMIAGVAMLVIALPIYITLTAMNASYTARLSTNHMALDWAYYQNLLENGDIGAHIRHRVIAPFELYLEATEGSYFYRGEQAFILPVLVPLFLLGVGFALAYAGWPGPLVLLLWWLAVSFGNGLMVSPDQSPRFVAVFPALVLFIAVGIWHSLALLLPAKRVRNLLVAGLVIFLAAFQADYYFNEHLPIYNAQLRNVLPHRDAQDAILRSLNFPRGTHLHFISEAPPDAGYNAGFMNLMRDGLQVDSVRAGEFNLRFLDSLNPRVDHVFFIEPGHERVLTWLQAYMYVLPPQYSPYDDIPEHNQFPMYYAPYLPGYTEERLARLDLKIRQRHYHQPAR